MKRILPAIFLLSGCLLARADKGYNYSLIVNQKDGPAVVYEFASSPVATFEGDDLVIRTDDLDEAVRHPLSNLLNMAVGRRMHSGIEAAGAAGAVKITVTATELLVSGLPGGTPVAVHDLSGITLFSASCDEGGSMRVSLGQFGKGIYVVNAGNTTSFKFVR